MDVVWRIVKVLIQHLHGEAEENNDKSQSEQPFSGPRPNLETRKYETEGLYC